MPIVQALYKEYKNVHEKGVVAVVTQPPKPVGRKKILEYSPVDTWAYKHKIPIFNSQFSNKELPEADLGVVASYGKIIPKNIIEHFRYGVLNIHPSLLPKFRGASPIQEAIATGETITGVTIIKMDEQMDHGPAISAFKEAIRPDDTNETLRARLFNRSAEFLIDLIPNYLNGKIKPKKQDHTKATFTKLIKKDDGFIKDPLGDPARAERLFRAFEPWPGIWTEVKILRDEEIKLLRLKILKLHLKNEKLIFDEVQLEGKNPVTWEEFKKGYPSFKL